MTERAEGHLGRVPRKPSAQEAGDGTEEMLTLQ